MKGRLIVTEGIDAAGKTTLARGLAGEFGAIYHKTPGGKTLAERAIYDNPAVHVRERFEFYLNACREDTRLMREMQEAGHDVICDRLLSSTIVHHQSIDPTLDVSEARKFDSSIERTQILLTVTQDEAIRRLSEREVLTRFEEDSEGFMHSQKLFLLQKNDLIIPTNTYDIGETLRKSIEFILLKK